MTWASRRSFSCRPDAFREYSSCRGIGGSSPLPTHRGKPIILHSCGNLGAVIEEIIDTGWDARHSFEDVIEPVWEAKRKYGSRIAHLGGFDMVKLPSMTRGQVRAHTRFLIEQLRPRRGVGAGLGQLDTRVCAGGEPPCDAERRVRGRALLTSAPPRRSERGDMMRIGVFTVLFQDMGFEKALDRIVACRDIRRGNRHRGLSRKPPLPGGRASGKREKRKAYLKAVSSRGLIISAFSCHYEPLSPDPPSPRNPMTSSERR